MHKSRCAVGFVYAVVAGMPVVSSPEALAADSRPSVAPREFFADQPKGLGANLVAYKLNYVGELFGDLSGGLKPGVIYEGYLKFGLGVNFEKLLGWKDTVFYVNVLYPHGESLTQNYVGDLNVVSNIDAYDSARIFKLWMQKIFADDRFSLRMGIMAADKEFFGSEGAAVLINSGFGTFPVVSQDIVAPVYPVSAPGVRVQWKPSNTLSFRAAVFSGDVGVPTVNQHNTRFHLRARDGASFFAEAAYKLNAMGEGPPGTYKLGGFFNSRSFDDLLGGEKHHGNYGVYAIVDQRMWSEGTDEEGATQGLAAFGRFAAAPEDRNLITFDSEAGLTYTGLVPRRNSDVLGVGVVYARVSRDARGARGETFVKRRETVLEVSYQAPLNGWLTVQPDLQYIFNPGAVRAGRDAVIAGLRFSLNF